MLVELKYVEVEIEADEILFQALRDGDLSVDDAVRICEEEAGTKEVLDSIADEDIKIYCDTKGIELKVSFEDMAKNLKSLSQEERSKLLWFIIGINDEEIKHLVTVELVIPKLNELVNIKKSHE